MPNTREKLIELIEQEYYCSIEEIADHLIANGVTVQEWISVKDRLPEDVKEVLALSLEYKEYQQGWLTQCEEEQCGVVCVGDGVELYNVTHWMHLPEPPKGE